MLSCYQFRLLYCSKMLFTYLMTKFQTVNPTLNKLTLYFHKNYSFVYTYFRTRQCYFVRRQRYKKNRPDKIIGICMTFQDYIDNDDVLF